MPYFLQALHVQLASMSECRLWPCPALDALNCVDERGDAFLGYQATVLVVAC